MAAGAAKASCRPTVRCSGYGALDYESHRFKRCMDSRGWRYDSTTEPTGSGGDY
jgi:hypothetical protein